MEDKNFHSLFLSLRPYLLPIGIACIGIVLLGYGLIAYITPHSSSSDISFETRGSEASSVKTSDPVLMVDVEGGVVKPGVYRIGENGRIQDAILAAGGFSTDADKDKTQHSINLAAKVSDGMKIYVPRIGEQAIRESTDTTSTTGSEGVAGDSTTGLININSASVSELDSLPGVGLVTADKIIANRPYGSLDELVSKKAVGKSVFEKIKERIAL